MNQLLKAYISFLLGAYNLKVLLRDVVINTREIWVSALADK